jgi:hypothetical protein
MDLVRRGDAQTAVLEFGMVRPVEVSFHDDGGVTLEQRGERVSLIREQWNALLDAAIDAGVGP